MRSLNVSTFHAFLASNRIVVLYASIPWNVFNPFAAEHFTHTSRHAVALVRLDLSTGVSWFSTLVRKALKREHGIWQSAYYLAIDGKIVRCHAETSDDVLATTMLGAITGDMQSAQNASKQRIAAALIAEFEEILAEKAPLPKSTPERKSRLDPYTVLGILPGATEREIDAAHRKKVHENHPDRVQTMGPEIRRFAEARMAEINAARDQLRRRASSG